MDLEIYISYLEQNDNNLIQKSTNFFLEIEKDINSFFIYLDNYQNLKNNLYKKFCLERIRKIILIDNLNDKINKDLIINFLNLIENEKDLNNQYLLINILSIIINKDEFYDLILEFGFTLMENFNFLSISFYLWNSFILNFDLNISQEIIEVICSNFEDYLKNSNEEIRIQLYNFLIIIISDSDLIEFIEPFENISIILIKNLNFNKLPSYLEFKTIFELIEICSLKLNNFLNYFN